MWTLKSWIGLSILGLLRGSDALFNSTNSTDPIDPVQNYCVRIDHQSTVKNGVLYIDGGIESFAAGNNGGQAIGSIILGYNIYLIAVNMSDSWDWKHNISQSLIKKEQNPKTGTPPPQVVRGALYQGMAGDNNIYLYGGSTSYVNTSFPGYQGPGSDLYTLWSYDTVQGEWSQYDISASSPLRPSSGASAEAPDQGLAFYFNGLIENGSSYDTTRRLSNGNQVFLEGMTVINTNNQTARNLSTAEVTGSNPRTRGKMQYLPGIGEHGILAFIGGSSKRVGEVSNLEIGTMVSMETIDIFDINQGVYGGNGGWFVQNTTGEIPAPRVDHCLVAASAPDNSSHNIYLYGGRGSETSVYDQIYVLSLPSFHWTKIFEGKSPRYSHSCHLVGNRQMLTIGGFMDPDLTRSCDWEAKGVAIYDMSSLTWGSVFDYYGPGYTVLAQVVANIGGTANGSAKLTQPVGGWSSAALAQVFNSTRASSSSTNSTLPSASPTPPSGGAIAGIALGSAAGVALMAVALWLCMRRQRGPVTRGPVTSESHDGSKTTDEPMGELPVPLPEFPNASSTRQRQELGPQMTSAELPP